MENRILTTAIEIRKVIAQNFDEVEAKRYLAQILQAVAAGEDDVVLQRLIVVSVKDIFK